MKELKISAAAENLDTVLDFVNTELEASGCPLKLQTQINIAIEEILVNIANYAYKTVVPSETGNVTMRIAVGDEVTIEFEDNGVPYNPLEKEDPNISASAHDRKIGGLGIYMVKQIMDSVEYRHMDGKNILIIRKVIL